MKKQHEQTPIIQADRLSVSTPEGEPVLHDVSVSIPRGARLLITGPSGAGKTTLLSALIGNVRPEQVTSGSVRLFGHELYDVSSAIRSRGRKQHRALPYKRRDQVLRERVGIYLQHPDLNDSWTVHENLEEPAQLSGRHPRDMFDPTVIAEKLGIADILEDQTGSKSGGQKQRIALGALLVPRPELLVLDEPTSALSEADRSRTLHTLVELSDGYGMTAVMISHDDEAAGFATHTLHMRSGMVLKAPETQAS